jgi:hypothetical protein
MEMEEDKDENKNKAAPPFSSGDSVRAIYNIPTRKGIIQKDSIGTVQYRTWDLDHKQLLAVMWRSLGRDGETRDGDESEILTVYLDDVERVDKVRV